MTGSEEGGAIPLSGEESIPAGDDLHIRAFLIADVRGWTVFTQERGDEGAGKLAAKFARLVREVVEGRGGKLLELRGDEAMCVFGSPRQAIRAAADLQERFVEETLADPELPLTVGIGLDAGEAVEVEGGYRGGALNLAARLCSQAVAGEILASREVAHLARRVEGVTYLDRGSISLKGLSEPVAFVRVVPDGVDAVERLSPYAPVLAPEPRHRRRPSWPAIVAAGLAVILIAVGLPLLLSDDEPIDIGSNSIASIDAVDGSLASATELGQRPGASAIGFGSLWVAQPDRGVVARVSLEDGSVIDPSIRVGASPAGVAVGEGSVWVTNASDGTVSRIDVETNEVSQQIDAGSGPSGIAVGDGALWVADAIRGELLRVDLASRETEPVPMPGQPSGVAYTPDGVWISVAPGRISRVDPAELTVTFTEDVGDGPTAVLPAFGSIWVANQLDGTVSRLEPSTGRALTAIPVGQGPNSLGVAGGKIWVANEFDGSITAIDPATNDPDPSIRVGGSVASAAADGDQLWVSVGASAAEHRGGTLTISSSREAPTLFTGEPSLDPALIYDYDAWRILVLTSDGLMGYRKVGGANGVTVVPDLAAALPQVSSDGLTYRFALRGDIRYSTGELVRPEDFRYGLQRTFSLSGDAASIFDAIDGASACFAEPATCDLRDAVEVDEGSVTIHLARPDADLPLKLTLPFAYPVPTDTPIEDQGFVPVPGTGPYKITRAGPRGIELVRNEEFREWSTAAQPDGFVDAISLTFGEDPSEAFDRLNAGEVDWMAAPPESDDVVSLQGAHPDRVVQSEQTGTYYIGFDVSRPPFDDPRVRRAVNFAIDRDHLVGLLGGPSIHNRTCQILPSTLPGYEPFCPFTLEPDAGAWSAPDLDEAKALIHEADPGDQRVVVWVSEEDPFLTGEVDAMTYVVDVLNDIGLDAALREAEANPYGEAVYGGEAQMYLWGWATDYLAASDYLETQFRCGSVQNASNFCSHSLDRRMARAKELQSTDPSAANAAWSEIEHDLVEAGIWAPVMNPLATQVFSARVGNAQVHPQWGLLLSRVWVE
jgi:YVTN family beta-propeller protein